MAIPSAQRPGFTVLPPGPVTDQIEVELRLSVWNPTDSERTYQVRFYWDTAAPDNLISQETAIISGRGCSLVQGWAATSGRAGNHRLLYQVEEQSAIRNLEREGREGEGGGGKGVESAIRNPQSAIREGGWPLEVISSDTPALPLLQAGWCDPGVLCRGGGYPMERDVVEQDVRDQIDSMKRIGMNVVIVTYVEMEGVGPFYPSALAELGKPCFDFDVIEAILSQADHHGMHVFLGLGRGEDLLLLWEGLDDPARIEKAVALGKRVAAELWQRYHHHPSFYGWYFTHEMNDLAQASAYYDPLADFCHAFAPDKPVLVAPAGTPILSPEVLRRSHVDIFAYQDAVGPGYQDYRYTLDPEVRLADLDAVYGHYRDVHEGTRKHLWTDLEIWRANPATGYVPFLPAPMEQVQRQLAIESRYVEMITGYEFFSMMGSPDSTLRLGGAEAVRLYREYEDYYREILQTLIASPPRRE